MLNFLFKCAIDNILKRGNTLFIDINVPLISECSDNIISLLPEKCNYIRISIKNNRMLLGILLIKINYLIVLTYRNNKSICVKIKMYNFKKYYVIFID